MAKNKVEKKAVGTAGKLSTYRPAIDTSIFLLSLLGILVVVHLWIQTDRGFDRGCFGFTSPGEVAATVDCEAVTRSDAGSFFGVSNVVWGFLYYVGIAGLSFLVVARPRSVARYKRWRGAAITAGFLYSMYLVYVQYSQIGQFCRLCLISASIVTVMFLLQVVDYRSAMKVAKDKLAVSVKRVPLFGVLAVGTVLLAGADVLYFRNLPEGSDGRSGTPVGIAAEEGLEVSGECVYDPDKPVVENYRDLVSFSDPSKGNPQADVTVIEFFDPNCPHCKTLHPVIVDAVARYGEKAWFVWRPFILWDISMPQIEALYISALDGKFFEMLEAQFDRQRKTGIPVDELVEMSHEIGLDSTLTRSRLQRGSYRSIIMRQRQTGIDAGISGVPAVMINGRYVHRASRTIDCLGELIEAAAK